LPRYVKDAFESLADIYAEYCELFFDPKEKKYIDKVIAVVKNYNNLVLVN